MDDLEIQVVVLFIKGNHKKNICLEIEETIKIFNYN